MPNITNITPPRVPLVDPATGLVTREWYRFFVNLFTLTGGGQSDLSAEDLAQNPLVIGPAALADFSVTPFSVLPVEPQVFSQAALYAPAPADVKVLETIAAALMLAPPIMPALAGVTTVTATAPVLSSGGASPDISLPAATSSVNGYLSSADWTTFNGKQAALGFTPPSSTDYTYTGTGTGFTTSPTITVKYTRTGNVVTMDLQDMSATSNSTGMSLTGGTTAMRPAVTKQIVCPVRDNGTILMGLLSVLSTGEIQFFPTATGGTFTTSGTKSFLGLSFSYTTN